MKPATWGGYREGLLTASIAVMNSQIHTIVVAHDIESRIQDVVSERLALELRRQRRDARRSVPKRRRRHGRVIARA